MGDELLYVLGILDREVVAQARRDQYLLDARQRTGLAVELRQRGMVRVQVVADVGINAAWFTAGGFDLLRLAGEPVHVRGRAAEVRDDARETRHRIANLLDFLEDRLFGAALDDATLMLGDRAERAAAKAAAHDVHRKTDHLVGGNVRVAVGRVRHPGVGQAKHEVHLGRREGDCRPIEPEFLFAVRLHERSRIARVGLEMQYAVGMRVEDLVVAHLFVRRQPDDRARAIFLRVRHKAQHVAGGCRGVALGLLRRAGLGVLRVDVGAHDRIDASRPVDARRVDFPPAFGRVLAQKCGATNIRDFADGLAARQPVRDFHDGTFSVAVQQNIRVRIDQNRAPHLVLPVVIVRDAPERRLDATQHDGHVAICFLAALRVDERAAVRPLAANPARRIGIVVTDFAIRRIAVDHRVHVAGRHAEEQVGFAQRFEGELRLPVRLRDDPDTKALRLEQPADNGHAKRRVIDVGVTRDDDDVAGVPAELVHLGTRHRQKRRGAIALRPVFVVVVEGFRSSHRAIVARLAGCLPGHGSEAQ